MRGDYVDIVYKVGTATDKVRVQATIAGGSVSVEEPRDKDPYVVVEERNQSNKAVRTARFAKGEIVALIEGHETIKSKASKK